MLGMAALFVNICSLSPYGVPYAAPIAPMNVRSLGDVFYRESWTKLARRRVRVQDLRVRILTSVNNSKISSFSLFAMLYISRLVVSLTHVQSIMAGKLSTQMLMSVGVALLLSCCLRCPRFFVCSGTAHRWRTERWALFMPVILSFGGDQCEPLCLLRLCPVESGGQKLGICLADYSICGVWGVGWAARLVSFFRLRLLPDCACGSGGAGL